MKNSDNSEDVVCQTFKCYLNQSGTSCWQGLKMQLGFADFLNLAQCFGFASREAIPENRSFRKPTRWDFSRAVTQGWLVITHFTLYSFSLDLIPCSWPIFCRFAEPDCQFFFALITQLIMTRSELL